MICDTHTRIEKSIDLEALDWGKVWERLWKPKKVHSSRIRHGGVSGPILEETGLERPSLVQCCIVITLVQLL